MVVVVVVMVCVWVVVGRGWFAARLLGHDGAVRVEHDQGRNAADLEPGHTHHRRHRDRACRQRGQGGRGSSPGGSSRHLVASARRGYLCMRPPCMYVRVCVYECCECSTRPRARGQLYYLSLSSATSSEPNPKHSHGIFASCSHRDVPVRTVCKSRICYGAHPFVYHDVLLHLLHGAVRRGEDDLEALVLELRRAT